MASLVCLRLTRDAPIRVALKPLNPYAAQRTSVVLANRARYRVGRPARPCRCTRRVCRLLIASDARGHCREKTGDQHDDECFTMHGASIPCQVHSPLWHTAPLEGAVRMTAGES